MTATQRDTLKRMAEDFRTRGGSIEGKYGKHAWVQAINVVEAFEQCAEGLEDFLNYETLAKPPEEQAPPQAALRPVAPVESTNPS